VPRAIRTKNEPTRSCAGEIERQASRRRWVRSRRRGPSPGTERESDVAELGAEDDGLRVDDVSFCDAPEDEPPEVELDALDDISEKA